MSIAVPDMDFTDAECALLLAGLFELGTRRTLRAHRRRFEDLDLVDH
jgi:hypothetical protein